MIARILLLVVALILLPDIYLYASRIRKRCTGRLWLRVLWWIPAIVMLAYSVILSLSRNFVPDYPVYVNAYLLLLGVMVFPKVLFSVCSILGLCIRKATHTKRNCGDYVGAALSLGVVYIMVYGTFIGAKRLVVKDVDVRFDDLPASFDGYRIALFSDLHIGSIDPSLLERTVSTINSLNADAVVFAGDIQNTQPKELDGWGGKLGKIRAKDCVFSVLGNHDYSSYVQAPDSQKRANERDVIRRERSYGWNLLLNSSAVIRRGNDSIVIVGEENGGGRHFCNNADIKKSMKGVSDSAFVILIQHDPSEWRRQILPESKARITFSGHTHGGQVSLFGLRFTAIGGREDCGLYDEGGRLLYVSTGVGGVLPLRFGVPPEIVNITLHKK